MKVDLSEDPNGFWLTLTAETKEETESLVRYGLNRTKVLRYAEVFAPKGSSVTAQLSLGSRKERTCNVAFSG